MVGGQHAFPEPLPRLANRSPDLLRPTAVPRLDRAHDRPSRRVVPAGTSGPVWMDMLLRDANGSVKPADGSRPRPAHQSPASGAGTGEAGTYESLQSPRARADTAV